jgi:hypothetical protein
MMRYLAAALLALMSAPTSANELDQLLQQAGAPVAAVQHAIEDLASSPSSKPIELSKKDLESLLQQAKDLGAPAHAIQRAIEISHQPVFTKKDVLAVFDVSQPSANKRLYVVDLKSLQVTAHYAAHGKDNGPPAKAVKFKGFQTDLDMVPLGPLKTAHSEVLAPYKTIVDRYTGTVYSNMIVVALEGVTSYNDYINHRPPFKWFIHPNWYATAGYRAKNGGGLGRSGGCVVVDPVENNELVTRLQDGALVYVTVGDDPIEHYL